MRTRSLLSTVLSAVLLFSATFSANAQAPESAEVQAQAAAMTLTSDDLPTGYTLTGETFLTLPDASIVPGVTAHYVSVYTNTATGQQIRSYVYLFENPEQATAGIEVIEGNEPESLTDTDVEMGTGNAELSVGTYETADGKVVGTADVTFLSGNAVVGVAIDNPDGTEPDGKLATDLAAISATRVTDVQAGEGNSDLTLTAKVVPVTTSGTLIQSGFLNAGESEAIYGTQGSALSGLQSSWVQTVVYGENGAAPRLTIGVTTFASADEATAVVEQSDSIFQPLPDQEKVEDVTVEGADSAVAYRYTSRDGSIAEQDSYRVIYSQGTLVTVIDVQAAPDSETAAAAANAVTASQATCQGGGACEVPSAPGVIPGE